MWASNLGAFKLRLQGIMRRLKLLLKLLLKLRRRKNWLQHEFVALDIESSGLDPTRDRILSIAWVIIKPPLIDYATGQYFVIHQDIMELKQSPIIHGLVRSDFTQADELELVLTRLSAELTGRILVGHNIDMDWRFLTKAAKSCNIKLEPLRRFDTLHFEHQRLTRFSDHFPPGALTLEACRARYSLPISQQHHAFSDALACAELFIAQIYRFAGRDSLKL